MYMYILECVAHRFIIFVCRIILGLCTLSTLYVMVIHIPLLVLLCLPVCAEYTYRSCMGVLLYIRKYVSNMYINPIDPNY